MMAGLGGEFRNISGKFLKIFLGIKDDIVKR